MTATYATSTLTVGGHQITAAYAGSADFAASTSSALTQTVSTRAGGPDRGHGHGRLGRGHGHLDGAVDNRRSADHRLHGDRYAGGQDLRLDQRAAQLHGERSDAGDALHLHGHGDQRHRHLGAVDGVGGGDADGAHAAGGDREPHASREHRRPPPQERPPPACSGTSPSTPAISAIGNGDRGPDGRPVQGQPDHRVGLGRHRGLLRPRAGHGQHASARSRLTVCTWAAAMPSTGGTGRPGWRSPASRSAPATGCVTVTVNATTQPTPGPAHRDADRCGRRPRRPQSAGHGDAQGQGLLRGGHRRRHLRLRQRPVLRLDGRQAAQQADRGHRHHPDRRRLLRGRHRRRHLRLRQRRLLRLDGRQVAQPADRRHHVPPRQAKGYWRGGVRRRLFAFGNAAFYGSMGGKPLNNRWSA